MYCALFWIQGKTIILDRKDGAILYCALFWIQGKTTTGMSPLHGYCTVPYFGFKAKLANFTVIGGAYCTVPYFGFKAKQSHDSGACELYCTVPYFGFKAKHCPIA